MSLFMPRIEASYPAANMFEDFYVNEIATVRDVVYKPYVCQNVLYYRAYIRIHEWHETESAYNFIKRLNNPTKETRFMYEGENWFVVRIDPRPWLLDLTKCVVTHNYLLDDVDPHDHSGFFGLQPIDSDWNDIKGIISDALDDFNNEVEEVVSKNTESEFIYNSEYSDEEDNNSLGYSPIHYSEEEEEEDDEDYLRRDEEFVFEARCWYEEQMEIRSSMSPSEFQIWEMKKLGKRTKEECQYENYMRTGYAVY
jgi:hypothetical protein